MMILCCNQRKVVKRQKKSRKLEIEEDEGKSEWQPRKRRNSTVFTICIRTDRPEQTV